MPIEISPIGHINTPYKEKFAIPRQPGLVTAAMGQIIFAQGFNSADFIRGIEQFSHLWLVFQFHQTANKSTSPLVRPPRLGGNEKVGVFASRSTHRPNNIGISAVKFEEVILVNSQTRIVVSGMDLLDNTPIIDIKPYIPYSDSIPHAEAGYGQTKPQETLAVIFSQNAREQLAIYQQQHPRLDTLIEQILSQDPRPAYHKTKTTDRLYGVALYDLNIQWRVLQNTCVVEQISRLQD
ncbi:tRNA (N6-threonylcarbamoyladenosine(37)-N6)-methyltransferase TrmO [Aliiglaciecola sp. SL4]|uniref:tRNA (N6-threonylcarbamoyladenosine(37)-N6)-methyltransferase TrmO n=1 Tax=Aliiglaciecola sp. SL4 TaxID=3239806 RepID=UPI00355C4726